MNRAQEREQQVTGVNKHLFTDVWDILRYVLFNVSR